MSDSPHMDSEVMTIEEIAGYLKVAPKTIHRMIRAHEIPAARVGRQWRFRRDAILAWLEDRTLKAAESGLVRMITTAEGIVPINRLIGPERIVMDLSGETKRAVLIPMVHALVRSGVEIDPERYLGGLLDREAVVSTAIGPGVAIPHLRHPEHSPVEDPCIILGIAPKGIHYDALDGNPTYVLAMPCSPSETVHLRLMAKIALLFKQEKIVEELKAAQTVKDVMSFLIKADCNLIGAFQPENPVTKG